MKRKIVTQLKLLLLMIFFVVSLPLFSQGDNKFTDAEVASVALVANQLHIDYAQIALRRSRDPEIQKFAQTMMKDYKAVLDQTRMVIKQLGIAPKDNQMSQKLQLEVIDTMKSLLRKSGSAFNMAYIENEIATHRAAIKLLNDLLIAQVDNRELKLQLQSILPLLQAHLDNAIMVQNRLSNNY